MAFGQKNSNAIIDAYNLEAKAVLEHYKNDPHPFKFRAAKFLVDNIYTHKSILCEYKHSNGETFEFNEFDYENIDLANKDFKCFKDAGGKHVKKTLYDIEHLKADFIISSIESSIKVWDASPWKESYDFNTFCEYILPYRNITEPIIPNWKQKYHDLYAPVIKKAEEKDDPVSVCTSLIKEMDHFEFLMKRTTPETVLDIDQIHFREKGSCVDLANATLLNARAIGLAVTYDFTPYHAASSNAHYWNTIINKEGDHIPFNGNLEIPYVYDANYRRLGKVLRKTFSYPKNSLTRFVSPKYIPERKLKDSNVIDVTSEYVDAYNIQYQFSNAVPHNIGYITVFNKGKWRAVWWSRTDGFGKATFTNMGNNIVYLPANTKEVMKKNRSKVILELEKYPIWLSKAGKQKLLKPDFKNTFSCTINRENEETGPYRDFNTVELINGETFNLHYWDGEWKLLAQKKVINSSFSYEKFPKNTLFRLTPSNPDDFERIFTIDSYDCKVLWF